MQTLITRFAALFNGLDRAHGIYKINGKVSPKGKTEGYAKTVREFVTAQHWKNHLEGKEGVGIVPIRDDATVVFGAIDIDDYSLDIIELEKKIKEFKLPLVLCKTKSAGAHCYLFTQEPVHAAVVRTALSMMAMKLGYAGVEIFPKQEALADKDDVGNWINMPYFDAAKTTRYCVEGGKQLTAEEFLDLAESTKVLDQESLVNFKHDEQEILAGAPPCLQVIAEQGAQEGIRNETLFNFAVYSKLRYGDNWETELDKINQEVMEPPLPSSEVVVIIKSLKRKDYFYSCKKAPLCNYCSKDICRQREFGIGNGSNGDDPELMFDSITQIQTDPPTWIVGINGVRLKLETEDILSQSKFAKACAENLRFLPKPMKSSDWRNLLNLLFKHAEVVEAPADAGTEGQFWYHVEQFCTARAEARTRDELLMGKPWHDEGRTYFRAPDLITYLQNQQFKDFKTHKIYSLLRADKNVEHLQFNCKGRNVQCWSIQQFIGQDEEFDNVEVPEVDC